MMNKAEKKLKEMEVLRDVYTYISDATKASQTELDYWRKCKVEALEENSEVDTNYYDNLIEELAFKLEKYESLAEKIFKLM